MDVVWIVVANQAMARIFEATPRGKILSVIHECRHEAGRAHLGDLVSDGQGSVHDRKGTGRHHMESDVGMQQNSVRRFAQQIVDYLDTAALNNRYDRLVIVAAPAFLGAIRKGLHKRLADRVQLEIPKDIADLSQDDIQSQLNRAF